MIEILCRCGKKVSSIDETDTTPENLELEKKRAVESGFVVYTGEVNHEWALNPCCGEGCSFEKSFHNIHGKMKLF